MMQKWRIRTPISSAIQRPLRTPPHCAFSTSQSRIDDERPRSNRQASAKAGRLIANLNTKEAPQRARDPQFGLRGLKPYNDRASTGTADNLNRHFRRVVKDNDQASTGTVDVPNKHFRKVVKDFDQASTGTADVPNRHIRKVVKDYDTPRTSNIRPNQSVDRSTPRRNGFSLRQEDQGSNRSTPQRNDSSARAGQRDQASNRSTPRRNDYSSQRRNPPRSSNASSSGGPPRRDGRFGSASSPRGRGRDVSRSYGSGDEALAAQEQQAEEEWVQVDLQPLVEKAERLERLATPPQEEWEVMDEDGNIMDEIEDEEEDDDEGEDQNDEEEENDEEAEDDMDRLYSGEDIEAPDKWVQSAYEGMEHMREQIGPGPTAYNPNSMKAEELHTSFITTGAGELGVAAAAKQVMGRLGRRGDIDYQYDAALASRLYRGEVVRFRDAEEKKRVMWMAEEFASNAANRIMKKKGEWEPKIDVGFVPVPEKAKEELAGKAMRGIYPTIPMVEGELARAGASDQEKTMAHLRRSVLLNETYSPTQGKSMVDFIAKMWPAEGSSKSSQSGKRKGA